MRLVETPLMIELDFYFNVFSMALRSFEKPYVAYLAEFIKLGVGTITDNNR